MKYFNDEISKEDFEKWSARKAENRDKAEMERFGVCIVCGYGLYGWDLYQRDGKYFESWSRGETCD